MKRTMLSGRTLPDTIDIARNAIAEITATFPALQMRENEGDPVELSITIPRQPGIAHEVRLALQNNDELTLGVCSFRAGWFPCSEEDRVRAFVDAVCGYLSGRFRILEHHRGRRCVKAELQEPAGDDWKTIATWSTLYWPFTRRKWFEVLRNA